MKRYDNSGFRCSYCKQFVVVNDTIGTANRNHCNICLWSKHVDNNKGDRLSECHGGMAPIGLTLKHEGYGRTGEIMLIHLCSTCQKISINRIARDDLEHKILEVFELSNGLSTDIKSRLLRSDIYLLIGPDRQTLKQQLFGK